MLFLIILKPFIMDINLERDYFDLTYKHGNRKKYYFFARGKRDAHERKSKILEKINVRFPNIEF